VSDEGTLLTSGVTSFNFTGAGVTATAATNAVTVNIPGGGGTYTRTTFTATAGQTSFTASYTVGYVQVYLNGVLLNSADYTATTGTTVVLALGASSGDLVDVIALNIGTFSSGGYTRTNYTATAGQTTFTASYTPGYVEVYLNGVLLDITDYTASSGSSIVLGTGAASGDAVTIVALTVSGFSGNVTSVGTPTSGQLASWTGATSIQGFAPSAIGDLPFSTDGSTFASTQKIAQSTSQATTSGTSIAFTSIPSWVKRITVMLNGVSLSGTSYIQIQIGTSGGFVTSGYSSGVAALTSVGVGLGAAAVSTGFYTTGSTTQTNTASGVYFISNLSGNIWTYTGTGVRTGDVATYFNSAAPLSLGGTLTQVRISSGNGTDTFDAGSVNILYE
jgi:hypothetical protein